MEAEVELDPYSASFQRDPYPTYVALRRQGAVYRNEAIGFWAFSRYEDVAAGLRDHGRFSSSRGTVLELLQDETDVASALADEPMIEFLDPPYQQQLRALVSRGFTPNQVESLEREVRGVVTATLDALPPDDVDVVDHVASPIASEVISLLLGIPAADRSQVRRWIDLSLQRRSAPPYIPDRAMLASHRIRRYVRSFVDNQRDGHRDNLVRRLRDGRMADSGRALTEGEICGFVGLLVGAGTETVSKWITNTLLLLQRHPEVRNAVANDPNLVRPALEESLRFWPPNQYSARVATEDLQVHETAISAGSPVLMLIGSANRDERVFPAGDQFDISRTNAVQHLSFGTGVHFCLGAALARLEARVTLEEIFSRFPNYFLDEERSVRVCSSNVHGFRHLPFRACP